MKAGRAFACCLKRQNRKRTSLTQLRHFVWHTYISGPQKSCGPYPYLSEEQARGAESYTRVEHPLIFYSSLGDNWNLVGFGPTCLQTIAWAIFLILCGMAPEVLYLVFWSSRASKTLGRSFFLPGVLCLAIARQECPSTWLMKPRLHVKMYVFGLGLHDLSQWEGGEGKGGEGCEMWVSFCHFMS